MSFLENFELVIELLKHLRFLTLNSVEAIIQWRNYISCLFMIENTFTLPYLHESENYLLKVCFLLR